MTKWWLRQRPKKISQIIRINLQVGGGKPPDLYKRYFSERLMVVGVLEIDLALRGVRSLKEKRRAVKSLKDRLRFKFNISVAEVDAQDNWQRAILGVALVSNETDYVKSVLSKVVELVRFDRECELVNYHMETF